MTDKSPREIERMIEKAKKDDKQAKKADRVVEDVYTKTHPQREHRESPDDN